MRTILALVLFVCSAFSQTQDGNSFTVGQMTPDNPASILLFGDATTNCGGDQCLIYTCTAYSRQPQFTWSINESSLTSIVDSANTATVTTVAAHGLVVGNRVTITGATDPELNASYAVATVGSTTTFTITTANVTDATYNTAPLAVATTAPRTTQPIWKVLKLSYEGMTAFLIRKQNSKPLTGQICDNRATLTYD